jgi:peptidoglycan/xylan/chitin deacetylase (PgdA/CDA1 family)
VNPAAAPSWVKRAVAAILAATGVTSAGFTLQRLSWMPFIRVVYYHDVPVRLQSAFREQLRLFERLFVPAARHDLEVLLRQGTWPHAKPGIILTFDDGLRSHSEVAAPLLEEFGFQGWFFVPAGLVTLDPTLQPEAAVRHNVQHEWDTGSDPRVFMTRQQLVELARRHVVGCHTETHERLSRQLSAEQLHAQIPGAQLRLESLLGQRVDAFSWVGGEEWAYCAPAMREIAGRFDYAFTTNTAVTRPGTRALEINRTHIEPGFPPSLVRLQLSGLMDLYYRNKRRRLAPQFALEPGRVR